MSFFSIEGYSYSPEALSGLAKGLPLDLEVHDYKPLSIREFLLMRKSLALYSQFLLKAEIGLGGNGGGAPSGVTPAAKAKSASNLGAGQRWITVHPNGDDSKGVPVLIQEDGGGTAHIVGGAGGRLNMLKLNKIKSKEEYAQAVRERREAEKAKKEEARKQEEIANAGLTPDELKAHREAKKAAREAEKTAEEERKARINEAEESFTGAMAKMLGWEDRSDEIYENYMQTREAAVEELKNALEDEDDKERIKAAKKAVRVIDKGYEQAMKAYKGNLMTAAKSAIKDIQHEAIADEAIRAELEARIGDKTQAEEAIRTEKKSTSKGFQTDYKESAEEKGKLTDDQLAKEKEEQFRANLQRIAEEHSPQLANMIEKGVETRKMIGEVEREIYDKKRLADKVTDLDQKAEAVKQYLAMKKKLEAEGVGKKKIGDLQKTIDGETVDDSEEARKTRDLEYGDGLTMGDEVSVEDFTRDLANEAARMEAQRQATINGSLLDRIKENPNGAEKWIANGNYNGFNQLSLSVLKSETLGRDVVDVLGLRAISQLMAKIMRDSLDDDAFADATEAIGRYHAATNEEVVQQAIETAEALFQRADNTLAQINEIKASNPDDLLMLNQLNQARIGYLDEANRALGQTLGSLEAAAALGATMKAGGKVESIETSLGGISAEDAVIRLRALGLEKDDYELEMVNGDRIATIKQSGVDKLAKSVDPESVAIERDVEDLKSGVYDEDGWLPAGVVNRPMDSFEDPGIDPEMPAGGIDNQSFGDDPDTFRAAQEAAHRALGEIPEGSLAFKTVADLSPSEQVDVRRYWEREIYTGSAAKRLSARDYQGEKGKTKSGVWQGFVAENGSEDGAYEAIKADLIANYSEEDMFGMKDPPSITKVNRTDPQSYRGRVSGASELIDEIDGLKRDLAEGRVTESSDKVEKEIAKKEAELPAKLDELYKAQLRDHYHAFMSGVSEEEYAAGDSGERHEGSPWAEYVRMHGSPERAQSAVLDTIRGRFVDKFADQYGKVSKKPLVKGRERITGAQEHVLAMLPQEERDKWKGKAEAELASAGASVANRAGGKFASGSWKDKALDLMQRRRDEEAKQGSMFDEAELKQEDGSERVSIGKRAETQLASMIPELSQNLRRGERFAVSSGMSMQGKHVQQQRAVKMFERVKRMNLTFGTGKGKSITSIGAFTNLHNKGLAKRAIFAVPSVVQKQFGGEVNRYLEPGKYKAVADPSLDRAGRIEAMKHPGNHMVVLTHQSIRDDMVYLMAQKMGMDEEKAKEAFNAMPEDKRASFLGETLKDNGIAFDMLTVDESHYTVNRKGKADSTMANVMDALNRNTPYFMNQSATPVKNDASEAYDFLHKVAPEKFTDRDEFLKRYAVDSDFSRDALRKLINRYNYSSPTETGVKSNRTKETIQLTEAQRQAYEEVEDAARRASRANKAGKVDVEAMKILSPNSFKGKPEAEHAQIAQKLQSAAGTIKEEALNRTVNAFDPANNAKIARLSELVEAKRYGADHPRNAAKKGDRAPGVVFAHNIASVEAVKQALESRGVRVGVIHGAMTGDEKDRVKTGFNPANPKDRQYDVVVLSDAGATGLNLQNAKYLVNYDLPQTSWVKEQREGRIDRHGQAHDEIDYHDLVTDTGHEATRWDRIQRKARLGSVFQQDPGSIDDSGLSAYLAQVRQERFNKGEERGAA